MIIVYGVIAVVLTCYEAISLKYMFEVIKLDKKQARLIGVGNLLFYGLTGTFCLIVSTFAGYGLYSMCLSTLILVGFAGIFLHTSLTLYMMSLSVGSAGLTVAIFISFAGIQAAISYFFLQ